MNLRTRPQQGGDAELVYHEVSPEQGPSDRI